MGRRRVTLQKSSPTLDGLKALGNPLRFRFGTYASLVSKVWRFLSV